MIIMVKCRSNKAPASFKASLYVHGLKKKKS